MSARKLLSAIAVSTILLFPAAGSARAQEVEPKVLDTQEQAVLLEVERYFNAIKTLKADFFQVSPDGEIAEGVFYLRRPGRLRIEYEPPVPVLIVSDGFLLHYHDTELGQISDWPVFDTPLGSLSADSFRFNESLVVTDLGAQEDRVEITIVQQDDPGTGNLTLVLERAPLQLRQWRVKDAQGVVTTVSLFNLATNIALSGTLFVFDDPREQPIVR